MNVKVDQLTRRCREDADFAQHVANHQYGFVRDDGVFVAPYHRRCGAMFFEGATCIQLRGHLDDCLP